MSETEQTSNYAFGPYLLSAESRRLESSDGELIALRGKGFELLLYLVQRSGRLVEKDELLQAIWPGMVVEENNLNQAVSALRQALGDDAKQPRYLATIKGRGYQFVGEVRQVYAADNASAPQSQRSRPSLPRILGTLIAVAVLAMLAIAVFDRDEVADPPTASVVEKFAEAAIKLLTDYPGSHGEPALSHSGEFVAYVSDADGNRQIWIKNVKHGEPRRITDGSYPASSPTWTADGQILYAQSGPDGTSIFRVGMLGENEPQLVIEHAIAPDHALHADAFVYMNRDGIAIARNNGRDRQQVSGLPVGQGFARREPALSPDGSKIAFVHADEGPLGNLWLISSTGNDARQLTTPQTAAEIVSAPTWSADGRYVVYSLTADAGVSQLRRIDIESGEIFPLTAGAGGADEAEISANGKSIAYTAQRPVWRLTSIDPESREVSTMFESRAPIILPVSSADRKTIAFFGNSASGMQLFTVGSDGENLQQLTFDEKGMNALPSWAGDGNSILYYRGRSLYKLDLTDGSDSLVFDDFHWSTRNWLDAFADRITFHTIDRTTGSQATVVRFLGEETDIELPVPIEGAQWSPAGNELLGFYRKTWEIMICQADGSGCSAVNSGGEAILGYRAMWSADGLQIYYLRQPEDGNPAALWRVNRNGTGHERIGEMPGFEGDNSYFDLTADGSVFYNHVDRSSNEVWLATLEH